MLDAAGVAVKPRRTTSVWWLDSVCQARPAPTHGHRAGTVSVGRQRRGATTRSYISRLQPQARRTAQERHAQQLRGLSPRNAVHTPRHPQLRDALPGKLTGRGSLAPASRTHTSAPRLQPPTSDGSASTWRRRSPAPGQARRLGPCDSPTGGASGQRAPSQVGDGYRPVPTCHASEEGGPPLHEAPHPGHARLMGLPHLPAG